MFSFQNKTASFMRFNILENKNQLTGDLLKSKK
jgi:hypothetical protein